MHGFTPNGRTAVVALALTLAVAGPARASASCDATGGDAVAVAQLVERLAMATS